jgi:cell division septation protein DedD
MSECERNRHPGVALVLIGLLLVAGCGKDKQELEGAGLPAYTPRSAFLTDSATVDTMAGVGAEAAADTSTVHESSPATNPPPSATLAAPPSEGAAAKPAPRPQDAARVPAAGGRYSLQLGSFRNLDNARALARRVEALGYDPVLESVVLGGDTHHRVLLRGLADRAAASRTGEALRAELGITYLIRQSD